VQVETAEEVVEAVPIDDLRREAGHLEADLFVDAAGRRGVLRSQVRDLAQWCPPVARDLLCTASQFMFREADVDGVRRCLGRRGVRAGDGVTWVGLDGGFSALAVTVQPDLERVSVLTGTIASGSWGSGRTILDRARAENPWIGDPTQIVNCPAPGARCDQPVNPGTVIPAPSINNGMNPLPANMVPGTPPPTSDDLTAPGTGSVQCNGQQPNPCTYTASNAAVYSPASGELVGPDGVKYTVSNSSSTGDDGWKEMLAPVS